MDASSSQAHQPFRGIHALHSAFGHFLSCPVLINLLPDFLDILAQSDPEAAYHRFLDAHRPLLAAYWSNYVLDLDSPHALEVIAGALRADRTDLYAMLSQVDIARMAEPAYSTA